jgi:hypothetical protein
MGDGSTIGQIGFLLMIAGVPTLLFGLPIAVLIFLSARRHRILAAKTEGDPRKRTHSVAWLCALLTLLGIGVFVFLMTAVGFTT